MALEVIVLVGLQASGKTTFYRGHFADTHVLVSKDMFPSARNKARRQAREIEGALLSSRSVVVDNTHPSIDSRREVIDVAERFSAQLRCYYFESKVDACLERNALRGGRGRVPDVGVRATSRALVIPTRAEGFAELWYVRIVADGAFEVLPWQESEEAQ